MPAQLETLRKRRSRDQGSVLVFVVDGLKRLLCTPVVTFGGTVRGLFAKSVQPIGTFEKREKSTQHLASTQFCNAQPVSSQPVAACQKIPAVYVYTPAPINASATAYRYRHRVT